MDDDTIPLDETRWVKVRPKVLLWALGIVLALASSWAAIKYDVVTLRRDVVDHGKSLEQMAAHLQVIESEARTARELIIDGQYQQRLINQKLDYLTGDKRGPRPASTSP